MLYVWCRKNFFFFPLLEKETALFELEMAVISFGFLVILCCSDKATISPFPLHSLLCYVVYQYSSFDEVLLNMADEFNE